MTFGERATELAGFSATLLGWRPDEFWSSTPAELLTALGCDGADVSEMMDRGSLQRLAKLFPDERTG